MNEIQQLVAAIMNPRMFSTVSVTQYPALPLHWPLFFQNGDWCFHFRANFLYDDAFSFY